MSDIKKEDLIKLYSDLDKLTEEKNDLQTSYIDLKLKSNKLTEQNKSKNLFLALLLIVSIVVILFFYWNHLETKQAIKTSKTEQTILLDSIHKITALLPLPKETPEVIYSIQIGVYKKLAVKFNKKGAVNFREVKKINGNAYQIGLFATYKDATIFKNELKKMRLHDVFVIAYNKDNEQINIKEALSLSNEVEFLKP